MGSVVERDSASRFRASIGCALRSTQFPDGINKAWEHRSNLAFWFGVSIDCVQFGGHINFIEAQNMMYVAQHTAIPVPKVFASYTCGLINRDYSDYGSFYDTYIFMTWDTPDLPSKSDISKQLKTDVEEMHGLNDEGYIGSINHDSLTDRSLPTSDNKGPFNSEQGFNTAVIDLNSKKAAQHHIYNFLPWDASPTTPRWYPEWAREANPASARD
ncbi:hypothetical protein N7457_000284 [Penicillium paradoxum]|uniref:uncharacterized protein n=1 Tax=Penicillium paradoxum TaxID=176176 RepID=UPI002549631A|nr:uncharacterized protein N7457_000284 [Penicillium paradoxum]KAJ5793685.1 hypothetical protein N7457_000284 [Penicillium paradoxum]